MFAGPNGSGKSTLKSVLPPELLGVYLNPDEIEEVIRRTGSLNLNEFGITATAEEIQLFFEESELFRSNNLAVQWGFEDNRLSIPGVNSYFASVVVDYLRRKLLEHQASFTFETVMSHGSKVSLLKQAQEQGYRTYLYYIATDDPEINISRVHSRVRQGGHSVPEDKIVSRYHRSLALLLEAIRHTNRAYIFDNSSDDQNRTWLAEVTDGRELVLKTDLIPAWFKKAVIDQLPGMGAAAS